MFLFQLRIDSSSGRFEGAHEEAKQDAERMFRNFCCDPGERSSYLHAAGMVKLERMDTPEKYLGIIMLVQK